MDSPPTPSPQSPSAAKPAPDAGDDKSQPKTVDWRVGGRVQGGREEVAARQLHRRSCGVACLSFHPTGTLHPPNQTPTCARHHGLPQRAAQPDGSSHDAPQQAAAGDDVGTVVSVPQYP